ncbi:unnamed protein product [Ambrosiozyma monospora]|uniref:Unnamed protein product n=1 Tax=Ambrosiozyma monospora TaxID=43982 RepID=A0A9W6YV85_AMBMO|nr:unnamed protein product [Ambrosiozyma monospora]
MEKKLDLNKAEDLLQLKNIWIERLQVPHNSIEDTTNSYSSFISQYYNQNYIIEMKNIKNKQKAAYSIIQRLEPWELQINERQMDPTFWIEYIGFINKTKTKVFNVPLKDSLIKSTFYRSLEILIDNLLESSNGEELKESWIPVWEAYIKTDVVFNRKPFYEKYIKFYENNGTVLISYLKTIDNLQDLSYFREIPLDSITNVEQFVEFHALLLSKEVSKLEENTEMVLEWLIVDIENIFPLALEFNHVFHSLERLCIEIYELIGSLDEARGLVGQLLENKEASCQVETWLLAVDFEKKHGDHDSVIQVFLNSVPIISHLDWPERLFEEWKRFLYLNGTKEDWHKFETVHEDFKLQLLDNSDDSEIEQNPERPMEPEPLPKKRRLSEGTYEELPATKKVKTVNLSETKKLRDRENLSILVTNLPAQTQKSNIEKFFGDCGVIRSCIIYEDKAVIEFSSDNELLAALTKDHKTFKGHEIGVSHLSGNILWVTNFPPDYDLKKLEELFGTVGKVISLRLPTLRANTERRFCYVEYLSSEVADVAIAQLNQKSIQSVSSEKKYSLIVKHSNSNEKKKRSGAVEEKRQVYVHKLDFYKVTTDTLSELFSKYGEIEAIKLPLNKKNSKMGRSNDGYAFISFKGKESAQVAIEELDGYELFSRKINVKLSEPRSKHTTVLKEANQDKSKSESYKSREEIIAKTLSVLNLDDTISSSQLMSIMKEAGPVRKIQLNPQINAALVEFENVNDCGKAEIKFNGKVIGGKAIKIGSRQDFDKLARVTKKSPVVKPQLKEYETKKDTGESNPKSNEDFRKMFLGL